MAVYFLLDFYINIMKFLYRKYLIKSFFENKSYPTMIGTSKFILNIFYD